MIQPRFQGLQVPCAPCNLQERGPGSELFMIKLLLHEIANEARSAELAIITSYPTSVNGIIVILKKLRNMARSC